MFEHTLKSIYQLWTWTVVSSNVHQPWMNIGHFHNTTNKNGHKPIGQILILYEALSICPLPCATSHAQSLMIFFVFLLFYSTWVKSMLANPLLTNIYNRWKWRICNCSGLFVMLFLFLGQNMWFCHSYPFSRMCVWSERIRNRLHWKVERGRWEGVISTKGAS